MLRGRHPAIPQSRPARAVAAIGTALVTAAAGHLLSAGAAPPLIGLLLAVAAMAGPAWWLTRDERGWERLAAAQLTAQLGSHTLFALAAPAPAPHTGHGVLGPDLMVLAHLLAAAVAGGWLRCGERRAIAMSRRAVALLLGLVAALLGTGPRAVRGPARRRPALASTPGTQTTLLRHTIVHRGPPAVC
ncbi:hypothetical protein ACVGVM_25220 [Pseudonocardia bannensis]|uniref:Uncharacterized protein n=1 Tax=Pseudonocardia bannensis TaxID=630973 RepID=A0A848DK20_9PSEU|nr:hypothetical protein [Pseudonocardia bannensis]NMH93042.1 hypothetical protein [Pseudonocardia bannensis]